MFPYVLNTSYKLFQTISYTCALVIVILCMCKCRDHNAEIYTVETNYVKWVTRVPAFTVCPAPSGRYVKQQLTKIIGKNYQISPEVITLLVRLLRPKKIKCPGCPFQQNLPLGNISSLIETMTPPCESQLNYCTWNGVSFPCCQYFQKIVTKHGICYTMNSEQTIGYPLHQPLNLVTSFASPIANLNIQSQAGFSLYIHERKATSFSRPRHTVKLGKKAKILYRFKETIALESAKQLLPSQRRCVLDEENHTFGFKKYHRSVCRTNCLIRKQLKECGCRHYFLTGEGIPCDLRGLQCLDSRANNLTNTKCGCMSACTGQEIHVVYASLTGAADNKTALAEISLTKPPTERDIYYAKTTIIETLVGFVCLTRLVTNANLYDIVVAFLDLLENYMNALNFFRLKTTSLITRTSD